MGIYINLNALAKEIHENAVDKGWWDGVVSFPEQMMMVVTEAAEAIEEYRHGRPDMYYKQNIDGIGEITRHVSPTATTGLGDTKFPDGAKPEGVTVEVADCIIRLLDICAGRGMDIDAAMKAKMAYNRTRDYRHGGKLC